MLKQNLFLILLAISIVSSELIDSPQFGLNVRDIDEQPHRKEILHRNFPELFGAPDNSTGKVPFIVGGSYALQGQFPYQVTLYTLDNDNLVWLCGGTLINETWVLTAAHCAYGPIKSVTVLGGHIDLRSSIYPYREVVTNKKDIIVHKNYDERTLKNDIAMIRLSKAIPKDNFVGLAVLPKNYSSEKFVDFTGTVSGFGRYSDTSNSTSPLLKYVDLPIMTNDECARTYLAGLVGDTNICGKTTNVSSSCSGDSGGPFTVTINNIKTIVGVVSFGAKTGCQIGAPAGFTRVTSYLDWIEAVMNSSPKTIVINIVFIVSAQIALMIWNF